MDNIIVDEANLNEGIFKQRLGGINRANKLFDQPITDILAQFNRALWVNDDDDGYTDDKATA